MTYTNELIARDLANSAADRASKAMLDTLKLCDTKEQAVAVAVKVFTVVAGQACGVIAEHLGVKADDVNPEDLFPTLLQLSREAKAEAAAEDAVHSL